MAEITDFGPRKTIFILAIVVGCFAVLWPKIFYPMLTASVTPHHTSDNSACCDVFFESDVTAADIMNEICQNILKHHQIDPRVKDALRAVKLTPQSANLCKEEILARCAIDLSTFLAERERLGKSYKQVLEEIRSFNSSLCLKLHFGIPLSQLGIPHLIRYHILMPHSTIKQERRTPPHAGGLHPAMRERGRAIPSSHIVPKVSDRPDHIVPKMRPPLGGAGHVVPAQKGNGTMGIIMPLYTLGIILFFLYTIVKVLKKSSDSEIISEYPGVAAEKEFRKMVFSPEAFATAMSGGTMHYQKERSPSPERPPTIEELKNLDGPPKSKGLAGVDRSPKNDIAAPAEHSTTDEEVENIESPTVKVMGMEMTASCEGKGSRPTTPIIPISPSHIEREKTPPIPIYLEGALPPQCELLVTDSETHTQKPEEDVEAPVVLSGKMTLSLISLDQNAAESEEEDVKVQREENAALDTEEVLNSGIINVREEEREIEIQDEVKEICEETQPQAEKEEKSQEEQSYKRDKQDKISYDEKREMVRESEEEVEETEAAEEEEEEEVEEIEESEQVKAQTEENQEEEEEVEVEMEEEEEVEVEEEEEAEEEEVVEEEEEEEVEVDEEEEDVNEENKDVEELEEDDEGVKQESEEEYEDEADEEDEDEEEEIENSQKGKDTRRGM
ncbi:altered inheritance of mitochondria protein 44-like isoform X2 [Ceratina calcarata]|uniref:Altered inheritance of mitochondria protein 44-like isoform X2 n=1 Tax=Ceratina calcarata TaxID=156304 RepID=A0AAJ7SA91_9HYME|nr:altered inheritance of mitochondria protein 44-like isoform X2 [Ceratina calcarata]